MIGRVVLALTCAFGINANAQTIAISEITELSGEAVGLISPTLIGLPRSFLEDQDATSLAVNFPLVSTAAPPAVIDLIRLISKSQFNPPLTTQMPSPYLLARLDHLEKTGSIDALEALLRQVGTQSPELFRRWLTASIWLGLEVEPCEALNQVPPPRPLDATIFCTALNGDPNKAIAMIEANAALGRLTEAEANLFLFYMDPDVFEDLPISDPEPQDGAVDFLMRFDLGLPPPKVADSLGPELRTLNGFAPWRERIEAAEALARSGAITGVQLFAVYQEGQPPASGQPWDRVRLAQTVANTERPGRELIQSATREFTTVGLDAALAEYIAPKIDAISMNTESGKCMLSLAATEDAPNIETLAEEPSSPLLFILRDSAVEKPNASARDLLVTLGHLAAETPDLRLLADDLAVLRSVGLNRWAELIAVQIYARENWCRT